MSIFHDRAAALEQEEFKLGPARGRLAVTLDVLTDALILTGQHAVYCRSASHPARDLQMIQQQIQGAKDLVRSVLDQLQDERDASSSGSVPEI